MRLFIGALMSQITQHLNISYEDYLTKIHSIFSSGEILFLIGGTANLLRGAIEDKDIRLEKIGSALLARLFLALSADAREQVKKDIERVFNIVMESRIAEQPATEDMLNQELH